MANVNITIKNGAAIASAFRRSPILMTKELNVAIKRTVIEIQGKSMRNTPVDTGFLRRSHYSRFMPLKGEVGTKADYDVFVHEGTRFMPARPYLAEAVNEAEPGIQKNFVKAVDNVLSAIGKVS